MKDDLKLVDLILPKEGFREFISSWILRANNKTYIVDPGPTKSLSLLVNALADQKPDYILLTHIHVDHAGGTGNLLKLYPEAKIIASELSHKHLIDPSKLIEASSKTLGDLMHVYGEITPVLESSILKTCPNEIEIIKTPGHAPHHITFVIEDLVFCGEAIGVRHSGTYLRPASPIKFDFAAYKESIKKLRHLNTQTLCFGHYGSIKASKEIYQKAEEQIELWLALINSFPKQELTQEMEDLIFEELKRKDPLLKDFDGLASDLKQREKIFIGNSIKGIWHFLQAADSQFSQSLS